MTTRQELDAAIAAIVHTQGNQSAVALAELLTGVLDYVDEKYAADVGVKTLGGVSLLGEGDVPIDFGGAGFVPQQP